MMKETIDLFGKILTNILTALYEPFGFSLLLSFSLMIEMLQLLLCRFLIHRLDIEISFTTHLFGKIQYIGMK